MSKFTALRVLIVAVFIGVIVGSLTTPSKAATTKDGIGKCWYHNSYNILLFTDEEQDFEIVIGEENRPRFREFRCKNGNVRITKTVANTKPEIKAMRSEVVGVRGYYSTHLFCYDGGDKAVMVNWTWHDTTLVPRAGEREAWEAWAKNYAKTHRCRTSG